MRDSLHAHQPGSRGVLGHLVQHVRDDWPATVFVACLFAVLDHSVGWLDAINGHGFVAIGNAAGIPQARGDSRVTALAVLIDQTAAETRYLDRSPLNRCELRDDLRTVYAAMRKRGADLLVVDLDLSPARWLLTDEGRKTAEATCENDLHRMIRDEAKAEPKIRTVLMAPIKAVDPVLKEAQDKWLDDMRPSVTFGNPILPVKYGLVIKQYCDAQSLAGAAYTLAAAKIEGAPAVPQCTEPEYIDPRKYLSGVFPVPVSSPPDAPRPLAERLDEKLAESRDTGSGARPAKVQAVFFGAAFGEGDTFVTPLGELYGVEIHAAGFLSFLDPVRGASRLVELLIDIFYGFLFGIAIAFFWSQYFKFRLSPDSDDRLLAPVWVVGLALTVVGAALVLTLVSLWLLTHNGLWLSPIPMAIGMLIESFVSGSLAQGVREADALKGQGRPSRVSFRAGASKFFGDDVFLLAGKGKTLSASLLAFYLTIWIAVVVSALALALLPH